MRKWKGSFLRRKLKKQKTRVGFAVLQKDRITGLGRWHTWDENGEDKALFDPGLPLELIPDQLQEGTFIEIYARNN